MLTIDSIPLPEGTADPRVEADDARDTWSPLECLKAAVFWWIWGVVNSALLLVRASHFIVLALLIVYVLPLFVKAVSSLLQTAVCP